MSIPEPYVQNGSFPAVRVPSRAPASVDLSSTCQEVRTSLTVMVAAYRLVGRGADYLSRHEQRQLLDQAYSRAARARAVLLAASEGLEHASGRRPSLAPHERSA